MQPSVTLNRRQLAKLSRGLGLCALSPSLGFSRSESQKKSKYLITLTCTGGASINDSFLALSRKEVAGAGGNPDTLNCYESSMISRVADLPFSAVQLDTKTPNLGNYPVKSDQARYLKNFGDDLTVITTEGSSVNHNVAQHRSLTGNNAWNGRTLMEAVAAEYGSLLPMPYLNLASDGFAAPGIDTELPSFAKAIAITAPLTLSLGLSSRGQIKGAPSQKLLDRARSARQNIEDHSTIGLDQNRNAAVRRWKAWPNENRLAYGWRD